jgi:chromosome segregation ATPase
LQLRLALISPSNISRYWQSIQEDILTGQQIAKLNRIIRLAEQLIEFGGTRAGRNGNHRSKKTRIRRTGRELVEFRKKLKAERKRGTPVAALARKHGVSTAYIYMLP